MSTVVPIDDEEALNILRVQLPTLAVERIISVLVTSFRDTENDSLMASFYI